MICSQRAGSTQMAGERRLGGDFHFFRVPLKATCRLTR